MKITNNEIIVEFPEEEIATIHTYHWVSGFNNAIDKTERLNPPLVVDVEALAKIIFHDRYPVYKWEDASLNSEAWRIRRHACTELAQHLASNLDKWIIEKKEN